MTKITHSPPPAPWRGGFSVLDLTYNTIGARMEVPCESCGRVFLVGENQPLPCDCGVEKENLIDTESFLLSGGGTISDYEYRAKIGDRVFWFRHGAWFRIVSRVGERIKMVEVKNGEKLAHLDHVSGRAKDLNRKQKRENAPDPRVRFSHFWVDHRGRLRERDCYTTPPECSCPSEDDHEYTWIPSGTACAEHGAICNTCGEDHFHAEG